jgi:hypothetical protein
VPAGSEFQVNTYTVFDQGHPSVSADADGDFVVVWFSTGSSGTDTSLQSIQGQRYASGGSTQGAEFQINTYTTGIQDFPSVSADADRDFVVVWESAGSSGTDTSLQSIQRQRYASGGSTQGAEFQVNTYTTNAQLVLAVSADSDGDFVVVWESNGSSGTDTSGTSIQGQRYASDGSLRGSEFQVNTYTTLAQEDPFVAADTDGDFVVVWRSTGSSGTDTSGLSIQGQRYASSGSPQGAQFQVNTYTSNSPFRPSVALEPDGDFVVVWPSQGSFGTDTIGTSVLGQRYFSNGSARGGEFQVNSYTTGGQRYPSVDALAGGEFVVVWQSQGSSGTDTASYGIQGQLYASNGSTRGSEFQVNTYTTNTQRFPSVAAAAAGGFVVAWESVGSNGTDANFRSVQGQRYSVSPAVPPVPAMSSATRFALAAALLLLGAAYALRHRA